MNKKWIIKNNKVIEVTKDQKNEWCSLKRDLEEIVNLRKKIEKLKTEKLLLQKKLHSKNRLIYFYKKKFADQNSTVLDNIAKKEKQYLDVVKSFFYFLKKGVWGTAPRRWLNKMPDWITKNSLLK